MKVTDREFINIVKNSRSIRQILQEMGLKGVGGNYKTAKRRIERLDIDTSHLLGAGWNLGGNQNWNKKPLDKILVENSTYTNVNCLRKRLINENVLKGKCNNCGRVKWMGEKIPLELEHKNGKVFDHRIENLELLCPNCLALTKTYRGKNIGRRVGVAKL